MPEKLQPDFEDTGFGMDQLHPQGLVEGLRVMEVDHGTGSSSRWRYTSRVSFQSKRALKPGKWRGYIQAAQNGEKPGL